jgi:hypothetical protein
MYVVTLGIGWMIWSLVVWGQGQTPGKQIVKLRVYNKETGTKAKWGQMALRQFCLPMTLSVYYFLGAIFVNYSGLFNQPFPPGWPNATSSESIQVWLTQHVFIIHFLVFEVPVIVLLFLDALLIFKGDSKNRLVDKILKTDVLNESPI